MDKESRLKKESRLIDILGAAAGVAFVVLVSTAIEVSIRSQKERTRNLEEIGRLAKSDDGLEYELGKVEAFGHEFITFQRHSSFGVVHSPDCRCIKKGEE